MKFSKGLFKISKFVMFTFGTIVIAACLGLGVVGKVFSNESKDFLNTNISKANSTLADVRNLLQEADTSKGTVTNQIDRVNQIVVDTRNSLGDGSTGVKADITSASTKLQESIDALDQAKSQATGDTTTIDKQITTLQDLKSKLDTIDTTIGNPTDIFVDGSNNSIYALLNELEKITSDSGDSIFNVQNIDNLFSQLTTTINSVLNPIDKVIQPYSDQTKVNDTYDYATTVLLAVGGVIIGLIVIGGLLSLILYKRVDGKLVNRFNAKKELNAHVSKILKKYPNIYEGLSYRKFNILKFRVPLILRNLGVIPAYVLGGIISAGFLVGGVAAVTQKSVVVNTLDKTTNFVVNVNDQVHNVDTQFNDLYTRVLDTTNPNSFVTKFSDINADLSNLNQEIKDVINNGTFDGSDSSSTSIKTSLENISNTIDSVSSSIGNVDTLIADTNIDGVKETLNDLIGSNGSVTSALSQIENTMTTINQPDSKAFYYYDLVSKILIAAGSVILGVFILSSILLLITTKRIDGVAISRRNFKNNLVKHLTMVFRKYPNVADSFQRERDGSK